ncbi:hypothetical protein CEXT_445051 [Caerostris extrusa]|uniref:Uncharacterized protein n=1 Tax=Caerostris extrusa TaxID=172846 RepID=A0AAV4Y698_CAEEX|nr:hypothetical protein CEXT_445051 [Caerostris extrusa]
MQISTVMASTHGCQVMNHPKTDAHNPASGASCPKTGFTISLVGNKQNTESCLPMPAWLKEKFLAGRSMFGQLKSNIERCLY